MADDLPSSATSDPVENLEDYLSDVWNSDSEDVDRPTATDRKIEKKKKHEKERKARRQAEKRAKTDEEKEKLRKGPVPRWVKDAREEAESDLADIEGNDASLLQPLRILPGYNIPGIIALVMNSFPRQVERASTEQIAASIKHAVTHGVSDEAKILEQVEKNYVDDIQRYGKKNSPLAKMQPGVWASELATFRRAYPIGTTTETWNFEVTRNRRGAVTISFNSTPFTKVDGSVEEAIFTLLALPTKFSPTFHITLPMLRKALFDIDHGSQESKRPAAGGSYASNTHYKMKNAVELARWLRSYAGRLSAKTKHDLVRHGDQFWNSGGVLKAMGITKQSKGVGHKHEMMTRMVLTMMFINVELKLHLPAAGEEAPQGVSAIMMMEYMHQHQLDN